MQTQFGDTGESESLFQIACDNRDVFATGMLTYFVNGEHLDDSNRQFIIKLAKKVLGDWPVAFLDYDELSAEADGRFTGYRVIALCSAFAPDDSKSIEYALVVFHQATARVDVTPAIFEAFSSLHWAGLAESVPY